MKIKKILVALLLVFTAFALVGCVSQEDLDKKNEELDVALEDLAALEVVKTELQATVARLQNEVANLAPLEEEKQQLVDLLGEALIAKGILEKDLAANAELIEAKEQEIADLGVALAAKQGELDTANATILLLNAQKLELEKRPIAPTALELYIGSLVSVGATTPVPDLEFDFDFTPANAFKGLYFESSNLEIVTVNQLGQITGVRPGKATITATSVLNPAATSTLEVEVKEEGQNLDIVKNAVAEVLSAVKLQGLDMAGADVQFPYPTNTSVTIKFEKENGTEIVDGLYLYTKPAKDAKEIITVKAEYGDSSYNETFTLKVVRDVENNIFNKTEDAQAFVGLLLKPAMTEKLYASVNLPTNYMGVEISWSSNNSLVVSAAGEYVRPLDDTPVTLTAAYKLEAAASSLSYDIIANGYTAEEKMTYILEEGTLKPFNGLETNAKINFPAYDDKFNAQLTTYVSKSPAIFANDGSYVNQELAEETPVIFEVTIEYKGVVLGTKEFTVIAKAATDTSRAAAQFLSSADADKVPTWFPYGGEQGIQVTGLPAVVGETGVAIEWSGLAEDFDETLTLKVQYLRYHESLITATFKKEDVEDTKLTFTVNIGLSNDKDAILVGGRFAEQKSTEPFTKYDLLNTFSYFDKMVGSTSYTGQNYWSYFSGYTYYINGTFAEDGLTFVQDPEATRRQYFAMDSMVVYITAVDEDGIPTFDKANLREGTGGNWGILFVNLTDKEAKAKLASYSDGAAGPDGKAHGAGQGAREGDITFDGHRVGWTAKADGTIVVGSGKGTIQARINSSDPSVVIPANGFGMTYKTQENNADIVGYFANEGSKLTIEHYSLHPKNDYRNVRFESNLASAEEGILAIEAGETTAAAISTNLKNAHSFMNDHRLTDLEKTTFDLVRFNDLVARYALIKDADLLALKAEGEAPDVVEKTYLQNLLAAYNAYMGYIDPIKDAMVQKVWLLAEYEDKLMTKYTLTYDLNGGAVYANTKADVTDLFLNDLYQHLTDSGFNAWVTTDKLGAEVTHTLPSLEEFKNPVSEDLNSFFQLMNDKWYNDPAQAYDLFNANAEHFARIWLFEFWAVNNDAFTVDETSNHFIRQPEYNKWMRLMWYVNEMIQAGNQGGRDLLGRTGLLYDVTYLGDGKVVGKTTKWSEVTSTGAVASNRTLETYINGKVVPGAALTSNFPANYYLFDAVKSQELVDAEVYQYTAGTAEMPQPAIGREGYNFVGWALDAEGTQLATMTPQDLGLTDITLYAKWEQEIQLIPAPGAEIGSFAIESYDEDPFATGADAKTMLDANGTGGTYWYKVILKTTATAGIYEVRQVIGGVAYVFNAETDALSIHYHDKNPALDAIQAIGITVGDFVIFQGTDVTALEAGAVDFTATVYRAAE